jgi:hypothetical protein
LFPAYPAGLKGRRSELATLAAIARPADTPRIALVGSGGSGKSMLACALGHRVKDRFPGGLHWFRSGAWDARTVAEMLAIRFGTSRTRGQVFAGLRKFLPSRGPSFIVLDNHENDQAAATVLNELGEAPVTWVLTARRCLLGGVRVFPVVAPHSTTGKPAFPRVRALTLLLRNNPLALDIADAIASSGAATVDALGDWLVEQDVTRIRVVQHEDDLPEVSLLVDWAWERLRPDERRMLAVLAHTGGDHMDAASLFALARVRGDRAPERALARLQTWHLVQSPLPDRYALHAVVRFAVSRRTRFSQTRFLEHYLDLLEGAPDRLDLEQTNLYAAMDHAHNESNLDWMIRIDRLVATLAGRR